MDKGRKVVADGADGHQLFAAAYGEEQGQNQALRLNLT
jgi:hypothetical protein